MSFKGPLRSGLFSNIPKSTPCVNNSFTKSCKARYFRLLQQHIFGNQQNCTVHKNPLKTKIMLFLLLSLQDNDANIPKFIQNQFEKQKLFEFFWEQGLEQNNKTI